MTKRTHFTIFEASIIFLLSAIGFVTIGFVTQSMNFTVGILITEYVIVFLPPLAYAFFKGIDIKKAFRFNKIRLKHAVLIVVMGLFLIPTILVVNMAVTIFLSIYGNVYTADIPTAMTASELLLQLFLISFTAALCEETMFRGMMLNGLEHGINKKWGLILSSVFFGIMHFNLQNLFGPIILGLVFGYLVYRTDSIFAGMIGHATNNGVVVLLSYGANQLTSSMPTEVIQAQPEAAELLADTSYMLAALGAIFVFAVAGLGFVFFILSVIRKDTIQYKENTGIVINSDKYWIVKNNKDYLIVVPHNQKYRELTIDETVGSFKKISLENVKKLSKTYNENQIKVQPKAFGKWRILPAIIVVIGYILYCGWVFF